VVGGTGGAGGAGGNAAAGGNGGNGGAGGNGIQATQSTIINSNAVTGGNGGAGGPGGAGFFGFPGAGGAGGIGGIGVVGSGLTISNGGSIAGGFANAGAGAQAFGIVFTGGTNAVGGPGTISGGIDVAGGTFAPALAGSPIGTPLSFGGPLVFASGTQYVVRVSPTASDSATVTGAATLTGASVQAMFSPGSYVVRSYDILHATAGFGGTTFTGASGTVPGFQETLSYTTTDVFLNLTAALGAGTTLNQNQQNVAAVLNNSFNSGGTLPPGFAGVFNLNAASLANALSQLDGEDATDAEKGAFQFMTEFLGLMLDPFVDGRGGAGGGGGAPGFAPDQMASFPPDIALAYSAILKAPPKQNFEQRWTAWGSTFGGYNKTNGDPVIGTNTVTARDFGFAGGMDYHFSPDTLAGFSLAGGGTNWGLVQGLGTGRSDALSGGVYAKTRFGPWYLAGALAFADHWFTTNRIALGDQLTASFNGQSFGGRVETGYRYAVQPTIGVSPYAALQAQSFHTPRYSETDLTAGGFGLTYNAMSATDTRSELGARFDDLTMLNAMPLVLRARLAWAHDSVSNPALGAVFQALPGANFVVNGAAAPKNSALTTASAELHMTANWSLAAKFDGEFAKGSQTYAGTGTLRYTW
jgi:uncharacterized protein with beta-barrel porin domain